MNSTRERIRQIVERWFLTEPLLFSAWTTHDLVAEPRIGTIRIRRARVEYNPSFIESLDRRQLEEVLRCEAVRILLKHPYQRRKESAHLAYLASNITLQEYLQTNLPFPHARDIFGTNEYDRQYLEFYYHKLQTLADQRATAAFNMGDGSSTGRAYDASFSSSAQPETFPGDASPQDAESTGPMAGEETDEESAPSEPSPLAQYTDADSSGRENTEDWDRDDLLNDRINDVIRTAQETNRWGTVAGNLREKILATLRLKVDYRAILRQFRASILATNRVLTRMKPSRRYGFLYMGSRYDFTTSLLFAVDVSGSIGSDDLQRGFSVINRFFKYGIQSIDVIQFDTEIRGNPTTLKQARYQIEALGRGGTNFGPVMDYIDERRTYDGLIVFTDGFAPIPPKPANRRTRILWLFNNESTYEHSRQRLRHIGRAAFLREDKQ